MRKKLTTIAIALALTLGVTLPAWHSIAAAEAANGGPVTLSVSPPIFELSANPGQTITNAIRVTNLSEGDQTVTVDRRNLTALGEEGGVNLTEEDTPFSLASWISVNKEKVVIPSKHTETFEFSIAVPANAEPGGHFGSIIFKTDAKPLTGGSGSSIGQEVGVLILTEIAGDTTEEIAIASFGPQKGFYERGPITFDTRLENLGNVHLKPSGTITIRNMLGMEVAKINLDERNVLPDAIRSIQTAWEDEGFRMGRYTATLDLVYGSDSTVISQTTSFVILPYKIVLVVVVALAGLTTLIIIYRHRLAAAFRALAGK